MPARYLKTLALIALIILAGCFRQERVPDGVTLEGTPVGGWSRRQVETEVRRLAARDPSIRVAETVEAVLTAEPGTRLKARRQNIRVMGSYSTPILDRDPNRVHNIRLTVNKLEGRVIGPGEVFSFNEAVGEPYAASGFRPATVLDDNGRPRKELGGGMCQVSSTLYNAALEAGFKVVERHPHARPVDYVPPGRDATVYTDLDLKFENTSGRPVVIHGAVVENKVTLWLVTR
ncbi:MAG: hypothetical protein PWP12_920 [Bacillota bacterium]|nr:hypothetical protein [Bacillota bacterium]MDK2960736.1 hypothetical protein [Bacillota bacterium]